MANFVYNYLFCSLEAKDKLISPDYEYLYEIHRAYPETIIQADINRYLVIFSTRGTEYRRDFIEKFITGFKDTDWYCVEENEIEEGHFWWNSGAVFLLQERCLEVCQPMK